MSRLEFDAEPYPLEFEPESTALLIIDMQRDFVEPGGFGEIAGNDVSYVQSTIEPCRRVLETARQKGIYVIFVRQGYKPDLSNCPPARLARFRNKRGIGDKGPMGRLLIRGEAGLDIIPELQPLPGETIVDKPGFGAFYDTELLSILHYRGIKTLIVCGVATEICVDSTVREATDRGFNCILPEDCTASYIPEFKRVALEIALSQNVILGWVTNSEKIIQALLPLENKDTRIFVSPLPHS